MQLAASSQIQITISLILPCEVLTYAFFFISVVTTYMGELSRISSDKISEVVDAYEHALLGRFPRARYLPGKDAVIFYRGLEKLPEWISDIALDFIFHIPLPACLVSRKRN